jgi:replication initiation protein RepC
MRRRELGITPQAWEEAEAGLGWLDALVALVVVDRNRGHPKTPVRNPGGLLRDLAWRRRAGTLDLAASVMGVWRRSDERAP